MEDIVQQDQMEIFIVNVYHLILELNAKLVSFHHFLFIRFNLFIFFNFLVDDYFKKMKWNK